MNNFFELFVYKALDAKSWNIELVWGI